jgi:hypothetical protein
MAAVTTGLKCYSFTISVSSVIVPHSKRAGMCCHLNSELSLHYFSINFTTIFYLVLYLNFYFFLCYSFASTEMSHRSSDFAKIIGNTENLVRELL